MIRKKACLPLFILLLFIISCESGNKIGRHVLEDQSPLDTVLNLMEENKKYENIRSRSIQAHPREIKNILDRGYIVFAMTSIDQRPFFYTDVESGELIGLDVEIAYTIANQLGVKAVFNRTSETHDGVITAVINNEADIALSKLSITLRRAELIRFSQPYITLRQALLFNRMEFARIGTEERLPAFIKDYFGTLGVAANSPYHAFALNNFSNAEIRTFNSWGQAVDALFNSQVLAIYHDEAEILIVNTTKPNAHIFTKPVFISDKQELIAMAVSPNAPSLQEWLNVFLNDYMIHNSNNLNPSRLIERHFGGM